MRFRFHSILPAVPLIALGALSCRATSDAAQGAVAVVGGAPRAVGFAAVVPRCPPDSGTPQSRDGRYLAAEATSEDGGYHVLLLDFSAGTQQVISRGTDDLAPVFSPDSRTVAYAAVAEEGYSIVSVSVEGSQEPALLLSHEAYVVPTDWSADGKYIAYHVDDAGGDVWLLSLEDGDAINLTDNPAVEAHAAFSPDSSWVAFASNRSGDDEIWVDSVEDPGRPQQLTFDSRSTTAGDGGMRPIWNPSGNEIYYRHGSELRAQPVITEPQFGLAGEPRTVIEDPRLATRGFHVSPEGDRLLWARRVDKGLLEHYFTVIPDLSVLMQNR